MDSEDDCADSQKDSAMWTVRVTALTVRKTVPCQYLAGPTRLAQQVSRYNNGLEKW